MSNPVKDKQSGIDGQANTPCHRHKNFLYPNHVCEVAA
jgi:hypothetical protein